MRRIGTVAVVALITAGTYGAAAQDSKEVGPWTVSRHVDVMDDSVTIIVTRPSDQALGAVTPRLGVICKGAGWAIGIMGAVWLAEEDTSVAVATRLDRDPPDTLLTIQRRPGLIFVPAVVPLLGRRLVAAQQVAFRVARETGTGLDAVFRLDGLAAAMTEAGCEPFSKPG